MNGLLGADRSCAPAAGVRRGPPAAKTGARGAVEIAVVRRACPDCGAAASRTHATGRDWNAGRCTNEWTLVRCSGCDLIYLNPMPAPEAMPLIYGGDYGTHHLNESLRSFFTRVRFALRRRRMAWLRRLLPPESRLLDVGCGEGFQAALYRHLGPDWAVEASDFSLPRPEDLEALGIRATQGDYDTLAFAAPFDFISLCDVLEHVPDQARTLGKIARDLRAGGHLYLELPNPETPLARLLPSAAGINMFPEHTALFSRGQIARLLERAGFDVVWTRTQGSPGAVYGTLVNLIRKYVSASLPLPPTVGPLTIGPCFAAEWLLSLAGWGHGLTVLARKR